MTALPWTLGPMALLRQAGYPFDLLAELRDEGLCDLARAALRGEEALRATAGTFKAEPVEPEQRNAHGAALSRVGQLVPIRPSTVEAARDAGHDRRADAYEAWNGEVDRADAQWAEFRTAYAKSLGTGRDQTLDLFRNDASLRDALLLSNDDGFPVIVDTLFAPDRSPSATGRLGDLLIRYLQRVTSKNETHAHFGPYTPVRREGDGAIDFGTAGTASRVTLLSHWAAQAIADVCAAEGLAGRVRRFPFALLTGRRLTVYRYTDEDGHPLRYGYRVAAELDLDDDEAEVFQALRAPMERGALAAALTGPDGDRGARADRAVARLLEAGAVVEGIEVPVGCPDTWGWLRDVLKPHRQRLSATTAASLDQLDALLGQFTSAVYEERPRLLAELKEVFTALTGHQANRGRGHHYADRSPVFEECRSVLTDAGFGSLVATVVERDLGLAYDLVLAGPRLRFSMERRILHEWMTERFGVGTNTAYPEVFAAFIAERTEIANRCRAVAEAVEELHRDVRALVEASGEGSASVVELDPVALDALLSRRPRTIPALCNPDVLFHSAGAESMAEGRFVAVLGECHATRELLTHSSWAHLLQREYPALAEETAALYRGLLQPHEVLADLAGVHRNKTFAQVDLPGLVLEARGHMERAQGEVVTPHELVIETTDSRLRLRDGAGRELRLTAPPAGDLTVMVDPLMAFSFPRHFSGGPVPLRGRHLPRLMCGRVVLQRECWSVPVEEFGLLSDDTRLFAACDRLRRELGMPERCYVKVAAEQKPVYVDWTAPLLVRQLCRLVRKSTEPVVVSEMLPADDGLWLRVGGRLHTSELRFSAFTTGTGSDW
ncbi:lantibiotic dehydratase [Streptomyces sp. AS58]|uniref:lantibiotic dehydratase n=1 Tax=Streptomyces sp. AS58 TaxID=1519489 RepID=UPI000A864A9D|nr:lantibiotic dehydratase [Streptomyces sp. AS58]